MADELLARALGYPYPREPGAFVWRDGRIMPFDGTIPAGAVPCVAYGSNASPEQLSRKFSDLPGTVIPTVPAELLDHDVVYAPLIAHYGSIPATLAPCPGTRTKVWLQWLSPPALERMDQTEGVPDFYDRVTGLTVVLEDGLRPHPDRVLSYLMVGGPLLMAGEAFALAEVPAAGRRFRELTQNEVQDAVREHLEVPGTTPDFIRENVADAALRQERSILLPRGPAVPPPGPPRG